MIDDVDAEVEQILAVALLAGDERAYIQLELIQYRFIHNTVAVDKVLKQCILFNGEQVLFRDLHAASA
jgi:hypothetical protein